MVSSYLNAHVVVKICSYQNIQMNEVRAVSLGVKSEYNSVDKLKFCLFNLKTNGVIV